MKKKFIVCKMAFALLTAGILASCSKQELVDGDQAAVSTGMLDSKPVLSPVQTGSIIGKLNPSGKRKLWIYDANGRVLGPYASDFGTGNFRINELTPGNYKLVIESPATTTISSTDIPMANTTISVEVKPGLITDLGTINL